MKYFSSYQIFSVCPDAGARRMYLVCPQCGGGIYAVVAEMTKLQSAAGRQQQCGGDTLVTMITLSGTHAAWSRQPAC